MKDRMAILPMKALAALCLVLGFAPVCLLAGRYYLQDQPIIWALMPACAFLWGVIMYLLPNKARLPFAFAGIFALGGLGIALYSNDIIGAVFSFLPCGVCLLLLPPAWSRLTWEEWPLGMWIGGLILHLIAQSLAARPLYQGVGPYLNAAFLPYVFLMLLYFNRNGLRSGMHGAAKAPAALRHRNTALSAGLFLLALLAALWEKMAQWADAAWQFIKRVVFAVIRFFMNLLPAIDQGAGRGEGGGGMPEGLMEAGETSPLALFLEKVMYVVVSILFAAIVIIAVRVLYKKLKALLRKIAERFRLYASRAAEDYVDEAESTLNWEEKSRSIREKIQKTFSRQVRPVPWENLDGRQRVRRLYEQYLKKRPEMKDKTAREALTAEKGMGEKNALSFAGLYEKARYSDHEVTAKEADDLRKAVQ